MLVVEKEKALSVISNLIGDFKIHSEKDFEKTKKKQVGMYSFNKFGADQTIISEYGSYVFSFPF